MAEILCVKRASQEISLYNKEWDPLFEAFKFFDTYKHFLQIDISASSVDDMISWRGWVESRLRQLTLKVKFPHGQVSRCSLAVAP